MSLRPTQRVRVVCRVRGLRLALVSGEHSRALKEVRPVRADQPALTAQLARFVHRRLRQRETDVE